MFDFVLDTVMKYTPLYWYKKVCESNGEEI